MYEKLIEALIEKTKTNVIAWRLFSEEWVATEINDQRVSLRLNWIRYPIQGVIELKIVAPEVSVVKSFNLYETYGFLDLRRKDTRALFLYNMAQQQANINSVAHIERMVTALTEKV